MEEQRVWKAVLSLLRQVEWKSNEHCPVCGWYEEGPHSEDCALNEAISAINALLWSKEYV